MNCHYHPAQPAENSCQYCQKNFCAQCSDQVSLGRQVSVSAACFICGGDLDPIANGSDIQPFWSRLAEVYKYPLSAQGIATILVLAFFSALLQGWWLFALIPSIAMTLYAFACLRRTAEGEYDAPDIQASFEGSVAPVFYVGISVLISIVAAVLAFSKLGLGIGIVLTVVLVLIMPAVIILIAIEEKLLPALNLGNMISIIKSTGISYFVMVLFNILMLSSMAVLIDMFGNTNFDSLSVFLTSSIGNYYTIVMYHIMGYLVYQNHAELGYRVLGNAGVKQGRARTPQQRQRLQLELLVKAGQFDTARDIAKKTVNADAPIWEWERAFKLFCAASKDRDLVKFFNRYVAKLQSADELEKVAQAYLALVRINPGFELPAEAQKLDIAHALHHAGHDSMAIKLVQKLPLESQNQHHVGNALALLAKAFLQVPGGEKHAMHFQTEHALHTARQKQAAR